MDTIDINLKKKKRRKLFTNIAIASALSFAVVGVGVATIYNNDYQVTKAIEYDDDNNEIALTYNEYSSYTFENFNNVILELVNTDDLSGDDIIAHIYFNDNEFVYDEGFVVSDVYYYFSYLYNDTGIFFNDEYSTNPYKFILNGFDDVLEYSITLSIVGSYYDDVKNAIELDIQANQPYNNNTFLHDIIELLVGGIGATASGIGVGLSTLVSNLVIQNGAMSPFMAIVLIFGGIALAFGLSRWVVNLISSLGQRNR